jgi:hypothetical protein
MYVPMAQLQETGMGQPKNGSVGWRSNSFVGALGQYGWIGQNVVGETVL